MHPGDRHATAVTTGLGPVGAQEPRVLPVLVGQRGVVAQAQFLALVEVGAPRQPEHEHRGGARPGQAQRGVRLRVARADPVAQIQRDPVEPEAGGVAGDVVVGEHPGGGRADGVEGGQRFADDGGQGVAVPQRAQVVEVERLVHLARGHPVGQPRQRSHVRLRTEHRLSRVLLADLPPARENVVQLGLPEHGRVGEGEAGLRGAVRCPAPVGHAVLLEHRVGDVDPETPGAGVQPEAQGLFELFLHRGVAPVEVGLGGVEEVEVVLAWGAVGGRDAGPAGPAEERGPVVRRGVPAFAKPIGKVEHGAFGGSRPGGKGRLEERVFVGAVVGDDVDDDADAEGLGGVDQGLGVVHGAEERVNAPVVGDVVAGVLLRGGEEGGEPDGVHAQGGDLGQLGGDAGKVAHAGPGRVLEGARVDLVDHRPAPPFFARRRLVQHRLQRIGREGFVRGIRRAGGVHG